ncbi:MAG TPA: cytochrome c oxidase subunit II [Gaiellales bacterium]|nr:cytochrome c oxidase subunit II [Gaiellales bacterium]
MDDRAHLIRAGVIWIALAIVADLIVGFLVAPHMPPGNFSNTASDQTHINNVLALIMTPIGVGVITFLVYALVRFRQPPGPLQDGPPVRGNRRFQAGWVGVTASIVIVLAILGTIELVQAPDSSAGAGAGGGQGPSPISRPSGNPLVVQVIAQQWQFTYRFPQYGGVETFALALPVGRTVEFNVTSIDVIHSFWAYQLGVKADAVPGANNIAYTTPKKVGLFQIRCAELCGLWHGWMAAKGHVLSRSGWAHWIAHARIANAPATRYLPPYAKVYYPAPLERGG